MFEMRWLRNN